MGPDATVAFGTGAREFTLEMLEHHLASHPVQSAGLEALFTSLEGNRTAVGRNFRFCWLFRSPFNPRRGRKDEVEQQAELNKRNLKEMNDLWGRRVRSTGRCNAGMPSGTAVLDQTVKISRFFKLHILDYFGKLFAECLDFQQKSRDVCTAR